MHVSKYVTPPITLDNILCLGPRLVHCQTYTHKKWNFGFASLVDNYLSIVCTVAYIISQCHFLVQISYVIYLSTRKKSNCVHISFSQLCTSVFMFFIISNICMTQFYKYRDFSFPFCLSLPNLPFHHFPPYYFDRRVL